MSTKNPDELSEDEKARLLPLTCLNTKGRNARYEEFERDPSKLIRRLGSGKTIKNVFAVRTRDDVILIDAPLDYIQAHCRSWHAYHVEAYNNARMQKSLEQS